jgi:hypothetical protein
MKIYTTKQINYLDYCYEPTGNFFWSALFEEESLDDRSDVVLAEHATIGRPARHREHHVHRFEVVDGLLKIKVLENSKNL